MLFGSVVWCERRNGIRQTDTKGTLPAFRRGSIDQGFRGVTRRQRLRRSSVIVRPRILRWKWPAPAASLARLFGGRAAANWPSSWFWPAVRNANIPQENWRVSEESFLVWWSSVVFSVREFLSKCRKPTDGVRNQVEIEEDLKPKVRIRLLSTYSHF